MKRRWFGVVLTLFSSIAPLLSLFSPLPAHAAPVPPGSQTSYVWADAHTIVGRTTGQPDEQFVQVANTPNRFMSQNPVAQYCDTPNNIVVNGLSGGGLAGGQINVFQTPLDPLNHNCQTGNFQITIGDTNNADTTFVWIDSATIREITGDGRTFVLNPASKQFEATNDKDTCIDFLVPSGDKKSAVVTNRRESGGTCKNTTGPVILGNVANAAKDAGTGGGTGGAADDQAVDCDAGPGFTWIICGALHLIIAAVDTIRDAVIVPFLKEPPFDKNQPEFAPAFAVWSAFRNVASVFFILVFFLIVIGTALGFDNYTIKKVLPHLVAGAILVPFSWYFCAFIIDIGNILGQGIPAIVSAAGIHPTIDLTSSMDKIFFGGAAVAGGFILYGAVATIGLGAAISLLIGFLAVFLTLVMRKILIMLLVVISPFALLAWVLPNTEKWFREWWKNFFKLVMMYPIIMMLFEAGRIFSAVAGAAHSAASGPTDWVIPLFQIAGLVLPLFFVTLAFTWAGKGLALGAGMIGRASGGANNRFGKNSDWAKNRQADAQRSSIHRAKQAESDAKAATNKMQKKALQAKAAMNWRRAGLAGGSSETVKLKRSAAFGQADTERGTVMAEARQSREADAEDPRQRLASTTQSILNRKVTERGQRQGVLEGAANTGPNATRDTQHAARIEARDNIMGGVASAQGTVERDQLNEANRVARNGQYVSAQERMTAGRNQSAQAYGEKLAAVRGNVQGTADVERQMATSLAAAAGTTVAAQAGTARALRLNNLTQDKAHQTRQSTLEASTVANTNVTSQDELDQAEINKVAAAGGGTISLTQARRLRMQNIATDASNRAREATGVMAGGVEGRNAISTAHGRESMENLVESSGLAERDKRAVELQGRSARLQVQRSAAGNMSSHAVLEAAGIEAVEHQAASVGTKQQMIRQEAADNARADAEGVRGAALRPNAQNLTLAARETAKQRTANESAQRISTVRALNEGAIPTTQQQTDEALFNADQRRGAADAATLGTSRAVNTAIDAQVDQVNAARSAAGLPALAPEVARGRAVRNLRERNLGALRQTSSAEAIDRTTDTVEQSVGAKGDLDREIAEEERLVRAGAPGLSATAVRRTAEKNVRDNRISNVTKASQHSGATTSSTRRGVATGTANALDAQAKETADTIIKDRIDSGGTVSTQEEANIRAQAVAGTATRNMEAASHASSSKASTDVRRTNSGNIGGLEDFESRVNARTEQIMAGSTLTPGTPGHTAATDQARAQAKVEVGQGINQAAGSAARSAGQRRARAESSRDLGIANDNDRKLLDEMDKIENDNPGISRAEAREQASNTILSRDLGAIGHDSATKSARANRLEVDSAAGTKDANDNMANDEYNRIVEEQRADLESKNITGAVQDREIARRESVNRGTAVTNTFRNSQNVAGSAARIAAQDVQEQAIGRDSGIVRENEANLRQAPVEAARNAAYKEAYDAEEKVVYDQAYNDAKSKNLTDTEAVEAGEKAKVRERQNTQAKAAVAAEQKRAETAEKVEKGGITREEQQQAKLTAVRKAAEEQAVRAEANTQAGIIGINQAATAPGALNADERLAVATAGQVTSLAAESGAARERYEMTAPGRPLNQTYQAAEENAARTQRNNILKARADEAAYQPITVRYTDDDGSPRELVDRINGIDIDPNHIPGMAQEARELLGQTGTDKDGKPILGPVQAPDRALAIMAALSKTSSGRAAVREMQYDLFGRTPTQTIDPNALNGQARDIWEVFQTKTNINTARDFYMPQKAAYDGYSATDFGRSGWGEKQDYFKYLKSLGESTDEASQREAPKRYDEAARNVQNALTNAQVARDLNSDDYLQMFNFMQDDKARESLLARDPDAQPGRRGIDVIAKIYDEGEKAGALDKINKARRAEKLPEFTKIEDTPFGQFMAENKDLLNKGKKNPPDTGGGGTPTPDPDTGGGGDTPPAPDASGAADDDSTG